MKSINYPNVLEILMLFDITKHHIHSLSYIVIWSSCANNVLGARWFVSFANDHTRITWIFIMKEKLKVGPIFKNFHFMLQKQFQAKVQIFRTNNAREYFHSILEYYLLDNGIVHQSFFIDTL